MQRMRTAVQENNVYRWAGKILSALLKVEAADSTDRVLDEVADPFGRIAGRHAGGFVRSSQ